MKLAFVTSNVDKFKEAREILRRLAPFVEVIEVDANVVERQLDDVEKVAAEEAKEAYAKLKIPLFTEDSGLFIESLNGFPGPYSSYVHRTLGCRGILKLMEGVKNRKAMFKSAVALCLDSEEPLVFTGVVEGELSTEERGEGWGFDPIFIPKNMGSRTYGELGDIKNEISHRRKALEGLANYLLQLRGKV
ncbi:MAG: XTP/dITP diphosphatase [Candidatus Nezhaarchaeota archaeon]|nr:XTP/dITP diphosphatase [Candidatus Nezhaarchaeota archaeon]